MAGLRRNGSGTAACIPKDPEIHLTIPSQGITLLRQWVEADL
jgi:hypothetical protein